MAFLHKLSDKSMGFLHKLNDRFWSVMPSKESLRHLIDVRRQAEETKTYPQTLMSDILGAMSRQREKTSLPALFVLLIVFFGLFCLLRLPARKAADGHRPFLLLQIAGLVVNTSLLFHAMAVHYAKNRIVRLLMTAVVGGETGKKILIGTYVAMKIVIFFAKSQQLSAQTVNPTGRSLLLFHQVLKPISAFLCLLSHPGYQIGFMMLLDLMLDYTVELYSLLQSVYHQDNMFSFAICLVEIYLHAEALVRLSSVAGSKEYGAAFVTWMYFYCAASLSSLCAMLAGMVYTWKSNVKDTVDSVRF